MRADIEEGMFLSIGAWFTAFSLESSLELSNGNEKNEFQVPETVLFDCE